MTNSFTTAIVTNRDVSRNARDGQITGMHQRTGKIDQPAVRLQYPCFALVFRSSPRCQPRTVPPTRHNKHSGCVAVAVSCS